MDRPWFVHGLYSPGAVAQKRTTADWECAEKSYKDGPITSKPRIQRQTESDEIAEHVGPTTEELDVR